MLSTYHSVGNVTELMLANMIQFVILGCLNKSRNMGPVVSKCTTNDQQWDITTVDLLRFRYLLMAFHYWWLFGVSF